MMGLVSGNRLNRFWQKGVKPIKEAVAALQIAVEELSKTAGTTPDAVGVLTSLKTTVKTNLVAAVNELVDKKFDKAKLVASTNITEPGFAMDGAECSKALAELYSNSGGGILLWENSNPSAKFAAQTIELNSADFDYYEVFTLRGNTATLIVSEKSLINHGVYITTADSSYKTFARQFNWVAPNKLQITNASYEGSSAAANETLVPVKIIGYKL